MKDILGYVLMLSSGLCVFQVSAEPARSPFNLTSEQATFKDMVESGEFCQYPKHDQERLFEFVDANSITFVNVRNWVAEQCKKHNRNVASGGASLKKPKYEYYELDENGEKRILSPEESLIYSQSIEDKVREDFAFDGEPMVQLEELKLKQLPYQASVREVETIKVAVHETDDCGDQGDDSQFRNRLSQDDLGEHVGALLYTLVTEDFNHYGDCILSYFNVLDTPESEQAFFTAYDYAPYMALGVMNEFRTSDSMLKGVPATTSSIRNNIVKHMAQSDAPALVNKVREVSERDTRMGESARLVLAQRENLLNRPDPSSFTGARKAEYEFKQYFKALCKSKEVRCGNGLHRYERRKFYREYYPELL